MYSPNDVSCLWDKWTSFKHPRSRRDLTLDKSAKRASVGVNVVAYVTGGLLNKLDQREQSPVTPAGQRSNAISRLNIEDPLPRRLGCGPAGGQEPARRQAADGGMAASNQTAEIPRRCGSEPVPVSGHVHARPGTNSPSVRMSRTKSSANTSKMAGSCSRMPVDGSPVRPQLPAADGAVVSPLIHSNASTPEHGNFSVEERRHRTADSVKRREPGSGAIMPSLAVSV